MLVDDNKKTPRQYCRAMRDMYRYFVTRQSTYYQVLLYFVVLLLLYYCDLGVVLVRLYTQPCRVSNL